METSYYMIVDGRQTGPFVREELKYHNLRPDSMVWCQGLQDWVPASSLAELADLFTAPPVSVVIDEAPPAYPSVEQNPERRYGSYGSFAQDQYDPAPVEHTNWLPWAIVCTVLGTMTSCISLILGIVGIVQANKANDFYRRGNRMMGDSANSTAKTVTIIGLVLGVLAIAGAICFVASGGLQHYIDFIEQLD